MKSDFQLVGDFHQTFDHPKYSKLQKMALSEKKELVQFRIDLIQEEFNELKEATKNMDMDGVIDALCDLKYVINGMGHVLGIDLDQAFAIVHSSNMSKLCCNEQEALETIEYYKTLPGFENIRVGYKLAPDNNHYVIYNMNTGKILKSKYYCPANFSEMTN